jgi:hypothetical protein
MTSRETRCQRLADGSEIAAMWDGNKLVTVWTR